MYAALWRILPGPAWLRVLILLILAAAVVAALYLYVFPWAFAEFWPAQDSTVGGGG